MSKIPLANPQEGDVQALDAKKRFWRNTIISLISLTVLAVLVGLLMYFTREPKIPLIILSDAFGVTGLLGICFFGLGYVSSKGAFDLLSYSVKLVFLNVFRPKYRKEVFPKTFYDYKVKKDSLERKAIFPLLYISLFYLLIGIIFNLIVML